MGLDTLRRNERALYSALVAILAACGTNTQPDAGAPGCLCFNDTVPCGYLRYTWDASFTLCREAGTNAPNCIADQDADCVNGYGSTIYGQYVGALGQACAAMDDTSGDPYPTAGNHISCSELSRDDAGVVNVSCERIHVCGRRFEGLLESEHVGASAHGRMLAQMAWLEAASVHAFARLARDLVAHDAPAALVDRARRAAHEEARHARVMGRLARANGASPGRVRAKKWKSRTLEAIAVENAVEGCVGETFGALQAMWDAAHGSDAQLREAMASIAPDEIGHAALAWSIAQWASTRLDPEAAKRVGAARDEALDKLGSRLGRRLVTTVREGLGIA